MVNMTSSPGPRGWQWDCGYPQGGWICRLQESVPTEARRLFFLPHSRHNEVFSITFKKEQLLGLNNRIFVLLLIEFKLSSSPHFAALTLANTSVLDI